MERFHFEPLLMGLCIGVAAFLLNWWMGESSWNWRIMVLGIVGSALSAFQYGLARRRTKR